MSDETTQNQCVLCYWKDIFERPGCPAALHDALLVGFLMGSADSPYVCPQHTAGLQEVSRSLQDMGALVVVKTSRPSGSSPAS